MKESLLMEQADLDVWPDPKQNKYFHRRENDNGGSITLGDLHGNALKLLYFLVKHQVLNISKEDYDKFVTLYKKPVDKITEDDINTFNKMVDQAAFSDKHDKNTVIRLMGDIFADRGSNDYFTLKIIDKLQTGREENKVKLDILFSNHDLWFIQSYIKRQNFRHNPKTSLSTYQSLANFRTLLQKQTALKDTCNPMLDCYLQQLNLFSYEERKVDGKTQLIIFVHAPVGLETLEAAAKEYNVEYHADTTDEIKQTIDNINAKFKAALSEAEWPVNNPVPKKFDTDNDLKLGKAGHKIPADQATVRATWNRPKDARDIRLPKTLKDDTELFLVHGHDELEHSSRSHLSNMLTLDNVLGKPYQNKTGKNQFGHKESYTVLDTHHDFVEDARQTLKTNTEENSPARNTGNQILTETKRALNNDKISDTQAKAVCFQTARLPKNNNPTKAFSNYSTLIQKVFPQKRGKLIAGLMLGFLGLALIATAVGAAVASHGLSIPLSIKGAHIGGAMLIAGFSAAIGAGAGLSVLGGLLIERSKKPQGQVDMLKFQGLFRPEAKNTSESVSANTAPAATQHN